MPLMIRLNPFDPLQRTVGLMGRTFDGATRLVQETTEQASRQTGDATEYAGHQVGDATKRVGSQIEDTATGVGTQMQIGSASSGGEIAIADYDDEFVATTDLPGFSEAEIDATVLSGETLRIVAEHDEAAENTDESYLRRERDHSSVRRSIALPEYVAGGDATAKYRNGVLTVTIPKIDPKVPVEEGTATASVETDDSKQHEDPFIDTVDDESPDISDSGPSVAAALEGSVAELKAALATGDYDDRLDAVEDAEREGEDRVTAYEAIDDRRENIQEGG
jgi:HSP20 family protein